MSPGTDAGCAVADCVRPVARAGLCHAHYMRRWRYGDPVALPPPRWVDLTGRRFGLLVVLERDGSRWRVECDCGRRTSVTVGNLNAGKSQSCGDVGRHRRREIAGYGAAHSRVRTDRGRADGHACVDCGLPARQWSYGHGDPDELVQDGQPYSLDPWQYVPRCSSCHVRFDLAELAGRHHAPPPLRPEQPGLFAVVSDVVPIVARVVSTVDELDALL
jgi:hypothetical protein